MNNIQKKVLSSILLLGNISLTTVVASVATYAWYTGSTPSTVSYEGAHIEAPTDSEIKWHVLRCDENDYAYGKSYTSLSEFKLLPYDLQIPDKLIHSNVILVAEAVFPNGYQDSLNQLYVDISTSDELTSPKGNTGLPGTASGSSYAQLKKYTSNICQFKVTTQSFKDADGNWFQVNQAISNYDAGGDTTARDSSIVNTANTRYQEATKFFNPSHSSVSHVSSLRSNGKTFISLHNNTPFRRERKITLTPQTDYVNSNEKMYGIIFYIECSYNPKLVQYYIDHCNDNTSNEIIFEGDIAKFEFRIGDHFTGAFKRISNANEITAQTTPEGATEAVDDQYLIAYDGLADNMTPVLDGALDISAHVGNANQDPYFNYRDCYSYIDRIKNDEVTNSASYTYTAGTGDTDGKFTSVAVPGDDSTTAFELPAKEITHTDATPARDIIKGNQTTGTTPKDTFLRYNTNQNNTFFKYNEAADESGTYKNPNIYKLNTSATASLRLTNLGVSIPIDQAVLGDTNYKYNGVVTAYYLDDNDNVAYSEEVYTPDSSADSSVIFTGISTATIGNFTIGVTYADAEGTVASATYTLSVVDPDSFGGYPTGDEHSAMYTVETKTSVTTDETNYSYPTDSSAEFNNSYSGGGNEAIYQMTNGNSQTLTLSGYGNKYIHSITLNAASNVDGGAGKLSMYFGSEETQENVLIPDSQFKTTNWNGEYSTSTPSPRSYHDIKKDINRPVPANNNLIFKITASENSLYCKSYTIKWSDLDTTPRTLVSIELGTGDDAPTSTYTVGEIFKKPKVYAKYRETGDQTFEVSSRCTFFFDDEGLTPENFNTEAEAGSTYTVQVVYRENGIEKTTQYSVSVISNEPYKLEITGEPTKKAYVQGQSLDLTGLKYQLYYGDATHSTPGEEQTWSSSDTHISHNADATFMNTPTAEGQTKAVTLTYDNNSRLTATFNITIAKKRLTNLTVDASASTVKKIYNKGEAFSSAGVVVTAYYNDAPTTTTDPVLKKVIPLNDANLSFTGYDANLQTGADQPITVSYTEDGVIKEVENAYTVRVKILVTSISITSSPTPNVTTLNVNDTLTLVATCSPNNADNKNVTWSVSASTPTTSGQTVATVNASTGVVTANNPGTATIKATAQDGSGKYATYQITVSPVYATSITINGPNTVPIGGSSSYSVTFTPTNTNPIPSVTWSIEGTAPAGVSIDNTGKLSVTAACTAESVTIKASCVGDNTTITATKTVSIVRTPVLVTQAGQLAVGDKVYIATALDGSGVTGWNGTKDASVSTTQSEWIQWTVKTSSADGYTLAATIDGTEKYIQGASGNEFKLGAAPGGTFVFNTDGYAKLNNDRVLMENGNYYRFYQDTSNYTKFYVYKLPPEIEVTSVTIMHDGVASPDSIELAKDGEYAVTASILPAELASTEVTWTSTNEDVAAYIDGTILAGEYGRATITATAGGKSDTLVINVPDTRTVASIAISGTMSKTSYTVGDNWDPSGLVVTATMSDNSTKVVTNDVTWSYNPGTATAGTTSVTVTASYGGKTANKSINVTVSAAATPTAYQATYTVSTATSVNTSGKTPTGSSATFKNTYTTANQITKKNSQTLTLSGYDGCKITSIVLSMKSNNNKGAGTLTYQVGSKTAVQLASGNFNTASWNNAWTQEWVDITKDVNETIDTGETFKIVIAATVSSLYCQSFTINFETSGTVTGGSAPTSLSIDELTPKEVDQSMINDVGNNDVKDIESINTFDYAYIVLNELKKLYYTRIKLVVI